MDSTSRTPGTIHPQGASAAINSTRTSVTLTPTRTHQNIRNTQQLKTPLSEFGGPARVVFRVRPETRRFVMSTGAIIAIVVVVALLIAAGVYFLLPQMRSQRLRRRFGPEYDHAVQERGDRKAAERDLADRERRHSDYELKPISNENRDRYQAEWSRIQEQFVEAPAEAVAEADRLVNVVVAEMGYPSQGYERQLADLSVRHARTVEHYRHAHDVRAQSEASTDELRAALIDYRKVFDDLVEQGAHDTRRDGHGRDNRDDEAVRRG
jgi:hypothetical protein